MNVVITLTAAGTDTGPFNIYSDVNGYLSAFEVNISRASLLAGFPSSNVPNGTTIIRVKSVGICNNSIDIPVPAAPITTTITTTLIITTTTTTLAPTTTTTTSSTTLGPQVLRVHSVCCLPNDLTVRYVNLPALLGFGSTGTFTATDGKGYTLIDTNYVTGTANIFQSPLDTLIYPSCFEWEQVNLCPSIESVPSTTTTTTTII